MGFDADWRSSAQTTSQSELSGGSDSDKIIRELHHVLTEVQLVKTMVYDLSRKLEEGIQTVRTDTLRHHFENIETIYDKIRHCNEQAMIDCQSIKDPVELKRKLQVLQSEQTKVLQKAAETIPGELNHIDGFLKDTHFITVGANLALQNSKEFLTYYKKIETLVRKPSDAIYSTCTVVVADFVNISFNHIG